MDRGRTRLARHIAQKLPDRSDREVVYLWTQIHRKPELSMPATRLINHPEASTIRVHAVKRLARQDPDKAVGLWRSMQQRYRFSNQEQNEVRRSIGISMARDHHADAPYWLSQVEAKYAGPETWQ